MTTQQLQSICERAIEIVGETGQFVASQFGKVKTHDINTKGKNSLVSYVDTEAERFLVTGLSKLVPEAGFITEENTVERQESEYQWIVDPLDGTTNFLHRIPHFSVSVALAKGDELLLGIVKDIMREECFYGWKNGGAYLDGIRMSVSERELWDDSIITTGFPFSEFSLMRGHYRMLDQIVRECRGIRRLGSAALDLAYVADGRFEAYYEFGINSWDVAAGCLLVKEAGGLVTDLYGKRNFLKTGHVIASNPGIFEKLKADVHKNFKGVLQLV